MRRRSRGPKEVIVPPAPHHDSPQALYRAEKARRASLIDTTIMAEAKRLYDEAVAESLKKRAGAGMRVGAGVGMPSGPRAAVAEAAAVATDGALPARAARRRA